MPAAATVTCLGDFLPGFPIDHTGESQPIDCVNVLPRAGLTVDAIALSTTNPFNPVNLLNLGPLGTITANAQGIFTRSDGNLQSDRHRERSTDRNTRA